MSTPTATATADADAKKPRTRKGAPQKTPPPPPPPLQPELRLLHYSGLDVRGHVAALTQGVHFGWPSKEVKRVDGATLERRGGSWRPVDDEQYRIRPSVYEPTARRILAAAHLRPVCEVDLPTWEMMGSPASVLVYRCGIQTLESSIEVAEGRGAVRVGEENLAVHLGPKRAMVCATMAAFPGLQESFAAEEFVTMSLGGGADPQPARDTTQPVVASRGTRTAVRAIIEAWKSAHPDESRQAFGEWAQGILGTTDDMLDSAQWSAERLRVAGLKIGGGQ